MKWLGIGLVLAGLGLIAWAAVHYRRRLAGAAAAAAWPSVPGEVIESGVRVQEFVDQGSKSHVYHVALRYRYRVDGRIHEGSRLGFGVDQSGFRSTVEHWLAPYPAGSTPPVRYDPADPACSVLDPGRPAAGPWLLSGAIGLAIAGLGVWLAG